MSREAPAYGDLVREEVRERHRSRQVESVGHVAQERLRVGTEQGGVASLRQSHGGHPDSHRKNSFEMMRRL